MVTAANPGSLACLSVVVEGWRGPHVGQTWRIHMVLVLVVERAGWTLFTIGGKIQVDLCFGRNRMRAGDQWEKAFRSRSTGTSEICLCYRCSLPIPSVRLFPLSQAKAVDPLPAE